MTFSAKDKAVFHGRRIDLAGLEHAAGKTFSGPAGTAKNMNERTTLATELNVFANFRPTLPRAYCDSSFIFLGNIDPTLQRSVLKQMKCKPKVVGLDTMNYWIEGTPAELRETLKHTQILMINDDETRQLTGEHNLMRAAKHVFKMGPRTLVIKRGEHGALMVHNNFLFSVPAFPLEEVHDPTGAGDSFAGGFMGYLAKEGRSQRPDPSARNGVRFGAGELCRRALRRRAPDDSDASGNNRSRETFSATDGV
jgi:fructose-1-phosphate kinase PfkB-like protein